MQPPLRLILGTLCAIALALFAACNRTPAARAVAAGEARAAAVVPVEARWDDSDSDGIPDRAELRTYGDRENFRRWFTAIAEAQFYELSKEWNADQRDCAGLVRFAWREALRSHDRAWFQRMGEALDPVAPDVRAYTLERSPVGEKLFRTVGGSFDEANLSDGALAEYADARTLKNYNAVFISRERAEAKAGDLLFFEQAFAQKYPYHVMIYLGRARTDAEGASDWVVYHTGASPVDAGEVRKVRLSVLEHHPDPRWRPVASNRTFLGVYRLKILQ